MKICGNAAIEDQELLMATFTYTNPTVGGSEDTWGTTLNSNWTALGAFFGSLDSTELALLSGKTAQDFFPSGGIIMWSGSIASVPSGWVLCDGTNGTPDLRNRFVVGAGNSYGVGDTGGADSVTLSTAQIPSHSHTFSGTTSVEGAHSHGSVPATTNDTDRGLGNNSLFSIDTFGQTDVQGAHAHSFSGTTSTAGSGNAHENRPPYYALAYIMKG